MSGISELADLVASLRSISAGIKQWGVSDTASKVKRAADLLESQAVAGAPVAWLGRDTETGNTLLYESEAGFAHLVGKDWFKATPLYTAPQPAPLNTIRVDIDKVGICNIPVRDGVAYMPEITVTDIVRRARPAPVDVVERNAAFNPALDSPSTPEQALAVIKAWGSPSTMTFSSERAAAAAKLIERRFRGANSSLVIADVLGEVERATEKFPTWPTDPLHAVAVLNEEVGELNKAVLQCSYEPHKSGQKEVREEAIQVAAMAWRFLMSLDRYVYTRGDQHSQAPALAAQQKETQG